MMTDLFPTDPKRIRERIRRYERALKRELEEGYGGDGYGKRYLLGPLYMLMGDVDGALASFDWYEDAYAFNKLYHTMLENLYLVPFLLGRDLQPLDIWHGSNLEWIEYAVEVPQELLNLWDDVALQWARDVSEHPAVVEKVARYVAIHRELKSEPRGPRRSALVHESFALKKTAIPLH
jgi:hypothetical protein